MNTINSIVYEDIIEDTTMDDMIDELSEKIFPELDDIIDEELQHFASEMNVKSSLIQRVYEAYIIERYEEL